MTEFPDNVKVMVGIPTAGYSRNDRFYDYYNMLERPAGTPCMFARGQSPARNRNIIIKQALDLDCTHVMFIDDDIAFPANGLATLLRHNVDIVTGHYLMRQYPHQSVMFDEAFDDGFCVWHFPSENERGLIEIVNCGLGFVLIKTDVFKALESPWIRLGETEKDHWGDDISFFNRVRKAGFKIHCDLDLCVGHMAQITVYPSYVNGKWHVNYSTSSEGQVAFPAAQLTAEKREEMLAKVGR